MGDKCGEKQTPARIQPCSRGVSGTTSRPRSHRHTFNCNHLCRSASNRTSATSSFSATPQARKGFCSSSPTSQGASTWSRGRGMADETPTMWLPAAPVPTTAPWPAWASFYWSCSLARRWKTTRRVRIPVWGPASDPFLDMATARKWSPRAVEEAGPEFADVI